MREYWVLPSSQKHFDLIEHFKTSNEVIWEKKKAFRIGDIMYIYVGAPYSCIKFKTSVISDDLSYDEIKDLALYAIGKHSTTSTKYVKLKLIKKYDNRQIPLNVLKEHGHGQVQVPARLDRRLKQYIFKDIDNMDGDDDA